MPSKDQPKKDTASNTHDIVSDTTPNTSKFGNVSQPTQTPEKLILDVACGGRMFWFDKEQPNTLFVDKRVMPPEQVGHGIHERIRSCMPDAVMDFRHLDLPDDSFQLVVFDPPHLFLGKNSHTAKVYGSLDKDTWQDDLRQGFAECFRVLKPEGVLIFKWHEFDVPLKEVLKLTPHQPLFGHKSGKAQMTHWLCFMKLPGETTL